MPRAKPDNACCLVCQRDHARSDRERIDTLRPALRQLALQKHPPDTQEPGWVCHGCLRELRREHMRSLLERDRGELSSLESAVSRSAADNLAVTAHIDELFQRKLTLAQRLADSVARVGGSWPFVISFAVVVAVWIATNSLGLRAKPFDPYPYILLNLVLSCVAAIQAPVIMMSQNRSAARDRVEADEDFRVNLKTELEIATLHEKLDHLIQGQYVRLMELQETQLELLEELAGRRR